MNSNDTGYRAPNMDDFQQVLKLMMELGPTSTLDMVTAGCLKNYMIFDGKVSLAWKTLGGDITALVENMPADLV